MLDQQVENAAVLQRQISAGAHVDQLAGLYEAVWVLPLLDRLAQVREHEN
jgi:hypothetical protein